MSTTQLGENETLDCLIYLDKGKTSEWSLRNKLVHFYQGNFFGVKGTDSIDFIPQSDVPQGWDIIYANFDCDYRPL